METTKQQAQEVTKERATKASAALRRWRSNMPAVWYGNPDLDEAAFVIDRMLGMLRQAEHIPEHIVARAVFDELVSIMGSDNGACFKAQPQDYDRALDAVAAMIRAGYFACEVEDLDGDYWQMAAGESTETPARFDRAPEAFAVVNEVLNDIFDRPPEPEADSQAKPVDADVAAIIAERDRLHALVNSPQTLNFLESVRAEVAHQIERWGTVHDRAKAPADWFWLVGYLAGKALHAHVTGDAHKALHHTISTAAALANWHAAISLADNRMQPGSSDLQQFLEQTFGGPGVLADISGGAA